MEQLFRRALDHAGYSGSAASAEAVRDCFRDYHDSGSWPDVEQEEIDGLEAVQMAKALLRLK